MAICESVCKFCRREGLKLYFKGPRCYTDKCAVERRPYAPGMHGKKRGKFSEYAIRLREKQKVKRLYGLRERQFHLYYERADRLKGNTGENLLHLLESRLDSVVYRLGFAASLKDARQLVLHRHIEVNGKKVNIPSYQLSKGNIVKVVEKSKDKLRVQNGLETAKQRELPNWLEFNPDTLTGTVISVPSREDITLPIGENLIVEYYSR